MGALKDPHGGELKNLYLDEAGAKQEKARARDLPSWDLSMRQLCDIEMLLNGAFSPLEGFLSEADYRRVLSDMRLTSGVLWPMPITLDVTEQFAEKRKVGDAIALRDSEGVLIATMEIGSIYRPDFDAERIAAPRSASIAFHVGPSSGPVTRLTMSFWMICSSSSAMSAGRFWRDTTAERSWLICGSGVMVTGARAAS